MNEKRVGPLPKRGIMDIAAYVPGTSQSAPGAQAFKLSSNESPLGASPKAIAAAGDALSTLHRYPDGSAAMLRDALAAQHGLNPAHIVCGAGSDEILSLLAYAYLGPGDEGIYTSHGFLVYDIAIRAAGATPVVAPETELTADVDAILARVNERTRIVFLANPNNPTGTYLPFDEIRRLHRGLPGDCLFVIDAAYAEYVRRNDYSAGIELVAEATNVVMTRTFSKIYGLAALRLGWAYCPADVADALNRIRGPFNVNAPAIAAGVAALGDHQHLERAINHNEVWLPRLSEELRRLGLEVTPSVANFILVHFPDTNGLRAADADRHLRDGGIFARRMEAYGLPGALRISIGSPEANQAVVTSLAQFMTGKA